MNAISQLAGEIGQQLKQLDDGGLDLLFRQARSHNGWLPRQVEPQQLRDLWELVRYAPTAVNGMPMRLVFVISSEGKQRLRPCLKPGNLDKVMAAPVTAIIGYDTAFWEQLPHLFPHADVRDMFRDDQDSCILTAFRNSSLQGAWLMLAARAIGLDCGPMSGYDSDLLDGEFFAGTSIRSNFLCNLGYGDPDKLFPRLPRLAFEDACTFA
ncbi:malonic semialdehyde reductase [Pseudomonas citronellolis]|uniref:malonic semialdehyde reductase n=1 Tax=Pseudomonas citronellolis TaxID=53408 RepID=UPI00226EE1E1|nr:malonic semialdehyde reductase [Pseudomonas citronellolis]WAB92984.1 malonic semialdehyde reductase [Pseudomonas citronellolis]